MTMGPLIPGICRKFKALPAEKAEMAERTIYILLYLCVLCVWWVLSFAIIWEVISDRHTFGYVPRACH